MSQKKYEIVINGLSESIKEVDILSTEIESLDKRLSKLSQEKIKIGIDKSAAQASKEIEKNIQLTNDEVLKNIQHTEKLKQQNKEILKVNKEIALGIREQSGEYKNTLEGQRAYLAELKKSLSQLDLDDSGWDALRNKVAEVNEKVKDLEKSYGVFSRDVGHYENATAGLSQIEKKVDDVKTSLEEFRGKALFDVELGDTVVQFDDIGQAISEIDKLAQKTSASLMQMRDAGQANTEEYAKMQAEFEMYAKKSGELQRAVKYTDQLKDSVASTTYELDVAIRGFQELGYIMQGATAIAGLFGQNQEEIQKAMNATLQVMSLMQSAQQLINSSQQQGSLINKAYQVSLAGANTVMKAFGISAGAASVGVKALRAAIVSTGIGALVVALGFAVEALMKWIEKLQQGDQVVKQQLESLDELNDKYETIQETLNATTDLKLMGGLISDLDAANQKLDVARSRTIAYRVELLKLTKYGKDLGKSLSKYSFDILQNVNLNDMNDIINAIDKLENEYITLKGLSEDASEAGDKQAKVWDGQAKAALMLIDQLKDLAKAFGDLKDEEEEQKQKQKERAKRALEAEKELSQARIDNIKDEYKKKKAQAEFNFQQELRDVKERGIKVAELEKELREKLNNDLLAIDKEYQEKRNEVLKASQSALSDSESKMYDAAYQLASETYAKKIEYLTTKYGSIADTIISNDDVRILTTNFAKLQHEFDHFVEMMNKEVYGQLQIEENDAWLRQSQEAFRGYADEYKTLIQEMVEANQELADDDTFELYSTWLIGLSERMEQGSILDINSSAGLQHLLDDYSKMLAKLKREGETTDVYKPLLNQAEALYNTLTTLQTEWEIQQMSSQNTFYENMLQATGLYNQKTVELFQKQYDDLEQMDKHFSSDNQSMFSNIFDVAALSKDMKIYRGLWKDLTSEVNNEVEKLSKSKSQLEDEAEQIYKEIKTLKSQIGQLAEVDLRQKKEERTTMALLGLDTTELDAEIAQIETQVANMIKRVGQLFSSGKNKENEIINLDATIQSLEQVGDKAEEMGDKINKELIEKVANGVMEVVQQFNQMYTMIADMQYANEMDRIDKLQDQLDEELDMLQDNLDKKEALIEKYNDRINSIEGELETARGDRRLFLLDQINQEVAAREREYAEKQRLMKQEEDNAKKQEKLKQDAEKADAKRRKAQKVTDINMSIANTALAVVKTLSGYIFPLNTILAATVGALGAAQTAIIASTKYANGGVIQGASHASGGVKVLGGTAEVEGGEFITNKATTARNLELLEFINSSKKRINLADILEFYYGNNKSYHSTSGFKYAQGGQLPANDIDVRRLTSYHKEDDRPIYVSVVEIENVQKRVRNVRALAGETE